ncbi:MAG: carbamoyl phosphate synthase small subunit [Ruminococcaceae bacterium]|nr:carbamoyl phosphate synthase small subunit [Oscillospiraceae bacterium]
MKKAYLALADGTVFEGKSLGATGTVIGEIVFTTGMTGYIETLTDPSFAGQMVVMTYPVIGNSGVNREDCESDKVQVKAVIMKECATHPNNFRSQETLESYLISENVIAITGIDTRALTKIIRTNGAMNGVITTEEPFCFENYAEAIQSYKVGAMVEQVTCEKAYTVGEGDISVALLDFGIKRSTIASLTSRGAKVTVYPAMTKAQDILSTHPNGIMVAGGPGDPEECMTMLPEIKSLMTSGKPFFGVGLGHQLAALAMGGKTEKLKFGHRGANQPVKDLACDKTFVTLQNHGYAVTENSLGAHVAQVSHINVNDQTMEGIRYVDIPAVTVQFDPESKPGAKNETYILDEFVNKMGGNHNA